MSPTVASPVGGIDIADVMAIYTLIAAYFSRVDQLESNAVSELFSESGSLTLGTTVVEGRSAIAIFLDQRERGNLGANRVVRHMTNMPDLRRHDSGRITGHSTAVVFASEGELPLMSSPPSTICDFDDVYVQQQGRWLFECRKATVLFVGPSAAKFANKTCGVAL